MQPNGPKISNALNGVHRTSWPQALYTSRKRKETTPGYPIYFAILLKPCPSSVVDCSWAPPSCSLAQKKESDTSPFVVVIPSQFCSSLLLYSLPMPNSPFSSHFLFSFSHFLCDPPARPVSPSLSRQSTPASAAAPYWAPRRTPCRRPRRCTAPGPRASAASRHCTSYPSCRRHGNS